MQVTKEVVFYIVLPGIGQSINHILNAKDRFKGY
jgi:hypothetical protein